MGYGYGGSKRRISYAHTREWRRGHVPYNCCKGAHVVVTGGASGIGFELAKEAVARGAGAVSIIDVSDCTRAHKQLVDCAADGLSIIFRTKIASLHADVSKFDQVCAAIKACEEAQGPVDVIVANAGIGPCGLFLEADVGHWEKVNQVNYMGVVYTLKAAVPGMVARNRGRIIVTSSSGSFLGAAGISAYCASKYAVRGFLDSLRLELINTGVSVHMACPGFVNTTMIKVAQREASETVRRLKAAFVPTMMTAEQVAKYTWRGVERRQAIIGSPDAGGNMLVGSSLSASSARYYPLWLELLLAPLFVLLHALIRHAMEASTRRILAEAAADAAKKGP